MLWFDLKSIAYSSSLIKTFPSFCWLISDVILGNKLICFLAESYLRSSIPLWCLHNKYEATTAVTGPDQKIVTPHKNSELSFTLWFFVWIKGMRYNVLISPALEVLVCGFCYIWSQASCFSVSSLDAKLS